MSVIVKVGASKSDKNVKRVVDSGLGNFIYGVTNEKEAAYCRKNKVYFIIPEIRGRRTLKIKCSSSTFNVNGEAFLENAAQQIKKIKKAGGEYCMGLSTIGESGALVYCPKEYSIEGETVQKGETGIKNLPQADDMASARQVYIDRIKKAISLEKELGAQSLMLIDSSALQKYHLEAGIDIVALEVLPGNVHLLYSAIRGAAKSYNKPWSAHIAMQWYGGARPDGLWFKRWKTSLYYSYLSGADPIYMENGHYSLCDRSVRQNIKEPLKIFGFNSKECKKSRKILRNFYQFCQTHPRPGKGPKVTLGIVHGNLDGNPGLWSKWVWGQFKGDKWKHSDAEFAWDYLDSLYRKDEWFTNTLSGDKDYTGNPPYGQYDLVPIEASIKILQEYKCLVFLGWNTMTKEIYEKLKEYVKKGGRLVMALPHLSTQIKRDENLKLYKNGNFKDLFGAVVKGKGITLTVGTKFIAESSIKTYKFPNWGMADPKFINGDIPLGDLKLTTARVLARSSTNYYKEDVKKTMPVLTENSLGKGKTFLINSWCYPGRRSMNLLMQEILRDINVGEQGDIRLSGSDRIRYSVYEEKGLTTIYLLNTDFETPQMTNLYIKGKTFPVVIKENEMRTAYYRDKILIIPEDKSVYVESVKKTGKSYLVKLKGSGDQTIEIGYLSGAPKKIELENHEIKYKFDSNTKMVKLKMKLNCKDNTLRINN